MRQNTLVACPRFARAMELTDLVTRLGFQPRRLLVRQALKVEEPPERRSLAPSAQATLRALLQGSLLVKTKPR